MTTSGSWKSVVRVETTVEKTHEREALSLKRPVVFKPDREIDSDETWMFTDGSSSGWSGLVVLRPAAGARLVARLSSSTTRNVGAEMNGFVMALEAAVPGERVTIVSDFLWSIFYVLGWRNVHDATLRSQVAEAHALLEARALASLRFIHVKGHVKDTTSFGRWNHVADQLCSLGCPVDVELPASALADPGALARSVTAILASARSATR